MANWSGQRVVILGAARQGLALAGYLDGQGALVTLSDARGPEALGEAQASLAGRSGLRWALGGHPLDLLDEADLLCLSGGVPLDLPIVQEARRRGVPLSNDSQIFLEAAPCPVIGITGSAGKTTTTTLVGRMAQAAALPPRRVWVGGNIGNSLISEVGRMSADDQVVLELSSFQLELMTRSPQVAAVLNLTPNHLDRHGTMEAYAAAKAQILLHQEQADAAVLNREDPGAWQFADKVRGRLVTFGVERPPAGQVGTYIENQMVMLQNGQEAMALLPQAEIALRGRHNLLNVLAACAIAHAAGFGAPAMRAGTAGFGGVPHRLELVRRWKGAAWYNDSIATAPERAMAAIRAFEEPLVLLAGGRDKKLPWEAFSGLVRQRVDHLIAFGEAADLILSALGPTRPGQRPYTVARAAGLREAVRAAAEVVEPGDVVLLSPGGTSFDEFRDFEERGERYRLWVQDLS